MTAKVCLRGKVKIEGKCIDIKLSKNEIKDILQKTKNFLEKDGILHVGVDIPLYKENKGFIDFTTDPRWFEIEYRKRIT